MSSERPNQKEGYNLVNFYYELAHLQKRGHFKEINLDNLDESDIEIYLAFKKVMIGLKDLDSPVRRDDLKYNGGRRIQSSQFNINDAIRKRRAELTYNEGNPTQFLFLDYISRKVDEAYGL